MQIESQGLAENPLSKVAAQSRFLPVALVFALLLAAVPPRSHAQTFSVLYTFTGGTDGGTPNTSLARDKAGNLYGTTQLGGDAACYPLGGGCGVVFKLDPSGRETVLFAFTAVNGSYGPDGVFPSGLALDPAGNLYGTAFFGGDLNCTDFPGFGCGTVFKIDSSGKFTLLHQFTAGTDGSNPAAFLIRDSKGNLYGTTQYGGQGADVGTVFKVDSKDKESVLYSFQSGTDGGTPVTGLVRDSAGNLYGATLYGGDMSCTSLGCGTIFKVDSSGKHTVLYKYHGGKNGRGSSDLFRDTSGNLYGTTYIGGNTACASPDGCGTVFELTSANKYSVRYTFANYNDGINPCCGVIRDSAGNLYGNTSYGGTFNNGTVFKLDSKGKKTVLYTFTGGADGGVPSARLIMDSAGNLYGTTYQGGAFGAGTVFKITP